ncbi:amphi-Trp domain-containing protein [Halosimplex litoreum]|jgi:amphi-Trp domain-containing protein|uniref:Amphi-Trp domain-containing protein n=1 Tax=Halosimplex litoreum TaxID=1198301 RepID=A0A7T3KV26_9EURY|nr:amphi-Trp domain-containing protein [Halosimplex litoreum]QPV62548.1 amphi-Trp domain-containing protein [Halosimplex litoreum]
MVETVLFEDERRLTRTDVASYLRTIADRLETGEPLTLETGADSATVDVPREVEFEVKVEREGPADGVGELGLELELEWNEDAEMSGDSLSIQ